jgi:hypothetical protein
MKKFLILFLIINLIISKIPVSFARAQIYVPVSDPVLIEVIKAINALQFQVESILETTNQILSDELSRLNKNLSDLLTINAINKVEDVSNYFLTKYKVYSFIEDIRSVIAMNRINSEKDIEDELEEAETLGILKALREFQPNTCFSESEKEKIIKLAETLPIAYDEKFKDTFWGKINSLFCPESIESPTGKTNPEKQKSLLSYLIKPINLGLLASVNKQNQNNNELISPIVITPQTNTSFENDRVTEFFNSFVKYLQSSGEKAKEERRNYLIPPEKEANGIKIVSVRNIEGCNFTAADDGSQLCERDPDQIWVNLQELQSDIDKIDKIIELSFLTGGVKGAPGLKTDIDISFLTITKNVFESILDFSSSTFGKIATGTIDILDALAITASTTLGSTIVELNEYLKKVCSGTLLPPSFTDETIAIAKTAPTTEEFIKTESFLSKSLSVGKCLESTAELALSLVDTTLNEFQILLWFVTSYEKAVDNLIEIVSSTLARVKGLPDKYRDQQKGLEKDLLKIKKDLEYKKDSFNVILGYGRFADINTTIREGKKIKQARMDLYEELNKLRKMNRVLQEVANEVEEVFNKAYDQFIDTVRKEINDFFSKLINSAISYVVSMTGLGGMASEIVSNTASQLDQLANQNKEKYKKVKRYVNAINAMLVDWLKEKALEKPLTLTIDDYFTVTVRVSTNLYQIVNNYIRLTRAGRTYSRSIAFTEYIKLKFYAQKLNAINAYIDSLSQSPTSAEKNKCYQPYCSNIKIIVLSNKNKSVKKEKKLTTIKSESKKNLFSIFNLANVFSWRSVDLNLSK